MSGSARAPASSAAMWRPRRDHDRPRGTRRASRDGGGRRRPGGHRSHLRGNHDAGPGVSQRRHAASGSARHPQRLPGIQPRGRLHGLHVRAERRRQVRAPGRCKVRARGGRGDPDAHHRLDRPRDLRAVRRRRRRRGPQAVGGAGHHQYPPAFRRAIQGPADVSGRRVQGLRPGAPRAMSACR